MKRDYERSAIEKLPISAVVVSCNEGHLLEDCLTSIQFCSEIILVDLDSVDNTQAIAQDLKCKYILHQRVPIVEHIRAWIHQETKFDWILFVDPDEVYSSELQDDIRELFSLEISEKVGMIFLPWQFYFGDYKLKGTFWGGKKFKRILKHKHRNTFSRNVHKDMKLKEGFVHLKIPHRGTNVIVHKWVSGRKEMLEKHQRYLKEDGISMHNNGKVYAKWKQNFYAIGGFIYSFVWKRGFLDGKLGLELSIFFASYTFGQWKSLKEYELSIKG